MTLTWVVAFFASLGFTWMLSRYRGRFAIMDTPNERSLHEQPTPRTGGIGVIAAWLLALTAHFFLVGRVPQVAMLFGVLPVIAISLLDDIRHVSPLLRLLVHLAAAGWMVHAGLDLQGFEMAGREWVVNQWWMVGFTVLFVTWMINLYNFMDGMDGFAAGMAVFGFGCYAVLGVLAREPALALIAGSVVAAAAGFLIFNFPPARIFLGDTGAGFLGYLAAGTILLGDRLEVLPFLGGILVFSPFIVDATVTLARRLVACEAVWRAHRSHFYQRLVRAGWGHRRTVLIEYGLMLATAISAILLFYNNNPVTEIVMFALWALVYVGLGVWVARRKSAS